MMLQERGSYLQSMDCCNQVLSNNTVSTVSLHSYWILDRETLKLAAKQMGCYKAKFNFNKLTISLYFAYRTPLSCIHRFKNMPVACLEECSRFY